ncbi:hypothetical protein N0V85_009573, partial [Neurospora sp. IMI 360204]
RLIDLLKTWPIDRPRLVSSLHKVHTRVSEMDRESSVEATTLGMTVDVVFEQIIFHLSAKKREFMTNYMHTRAEWASLAKEMAFDRDDEEKAKEAHKNERKKAHQKALEDNKGEPPNDDEQCEKDAVTDTNWMFLDLEDTQHQQPYIDQEVKSLSQWKDGHVKPPTPILDRLYFCLKEHGESGSRPRLPLKHFVQSCTRIARSHEQLRRFPPCPCDTFEDLFYGPDIETRSREADVLRSTKEKLEQAYESELRIPSSSIVDRERYNGLLEGNPVDRVLAEELRI